MGKTVRTSDIVIFQKIYKNNSKNIYNFFIKWSYKNET